MPIRTMIAGFALLFLVAAAAPAADESGFVPLFDGRTLTGWVQHGGNATYTVDGGTILGRVGEDQKRNAFLCTEKTYGDFILRCEVKFDQRGNSGVQFRSHIKPDKDVVFGYQCEIDPSDRAWTGGIYDESRRGWINNLANNEAGRKAFRRDDWNEITIEARGPAIKTWVNGVACADLLDPLDFEGIFGLQVHVGKTGAIRWRNVRIKELGTTQWQPLWNGRDFTGWDTIGGGKWAIVDGAIRGTADNDPQHGHLITKRTYGDFALRLKFLATKGNSGLYFRVEQGGGAGVLGFQAEIEAAKDVGGLYETGGRKWVVQPTAEQVQKTFKPGKWNEMAVVAQGRRVVVCVNGFRTAELNDDPGRTAGHIALQLHAKAEMDVQFKDIEIVELK